MPKLGFLSTKGRIRRRTYILIAIPFGILAYMISEMLNYSYDAGSILFFFSIIIVMTVITILLIIKRLHDIGMKGINWLFILVPVLNIGFGFWLMLKDGEVGDNKYGKDPKGRKTN